MKKSLTNVSGVLAIAILTFLPLKSIHAFSANVSGHIETSYHYDLNRSSNQSTGGLIAYHPMPDSFYLNAAHVAIAGELEEGVGYVVEIDHGSDAAAQTNDAAGDDTDVQEAYLNFPVGPLSVTAGKFVTYEGIEVIEGPANPTITRGFLYGLAEAFTHVGAKAHIGLGSKVDVGVGLVNGRDQDRDVNRGKTAIFRVGVEVGDPLSFGISGSHGSVTANAPGSTSDDDTLTSLDLTGTLSVIPKFPINFQVLWAEMDRAKVTPTGGATTKPGSWSGVGLQPVLEVNDVFSVGFRVEYFDNLDTANYNITNYTVAPAYKVNDAVTVRGEVRHDVINDTQVTSGSRFFFDDKGTPEDNSTTATVAFSYEFGGEEN